jgi:hypothetical protein
MADPTYFIVTGPILTPGDDSSDAGVLPDLVAPTSGQIIFTYNIDAGAMFRLSSPIVALISRPVTAQIQSDGSLLRLKDDGTVGGQIYLLANDSIGIDGDLTINVRFNNVILPNTKRAVLSPFNFIAPTTAATKMFAELIPTPGSTGTGVTQGLIGVGFTGAGRINLDGTVQWELTNGSFTDPLPIEMLSVDGINGGTPDDTGIGMLGGGTP